MFHEVPNDAAEWDARLRSPDCTPEDREAFGKWYKHSEQNRLEYESLRAALRALRDVDQEPQIRSLRDLAISDMKRSAGGERRFGRHFARIAAAIGVVTIGVLSVVSRMSPDVPGEAIFATAIGERSTVTLSDGTVTTLNTNSKIHVTYSDSERHVTLVHGQALFEVAKNPDVPFVVVAGSHRITAIGTIFDVRYDSDEVLVTLVEGEVEVAKQNPSQNVAGASAGATVRLMPGQQLTTTASATPQITNVRSTNTDTATLWRDGRVFFEDLPLSEAVAEMNRYNYAQIVITDSSVEAIPVGGMFYTGRLENFTVALESLYDVEFIDTRDGNIELRAKREQ